VDEVDAKAGRYALRYVVLDDAGADGQPDPAVAGANADRAAADTTALAFIGASNRSTTRALAPPLNRAKLALLAPTDRGPDLTKDTRYAPMGVRTVLRVIPGVVAQADAAARWLSLLGRAAVYLIEDGSPDAAAIADAFVTKAPGSGLRVIQRLRLSSGDPAGVVAEDAKRLGARAVLYLSTDGADAARVVAALRTAAPDVVFMGSDAIATDGFLKQAGAAAEGALAMFPGVPLDQYGPEARSWVQRYQARFVTEPHPYAIYAYEAARLAVAAAQRAGDAATDRERMLAALRDASKDRPGLLGSWSVGEDGETTAITHTAVQAHGGRWIFSRLIG